MAKKKKIMFILIGVCVLTAGTFFFIGSKKQGNNMKNMKIQQSVVETGNIKSTVSGTGSVTLSNSVDVKIPEGVKITKIYVESGETVKKGTVLAKVDKGSVISALVSAKDDLSNIKEQRDSSGLSSLEKEELNYKKKELENVISDLNDLYENQNVKAKKTGVIGTINIAEGEEVSASTAGTSSSSTNSGSTGNMVNQSAKSNTTKSYALSLMSTKESSEETSETAVTEERKEEKITDFSKLKVETPVTGQTPTGKITETESYSGSIQWSDQVKIFQPDKSYTAVITLNAKEGHSFSTENLPAISNADSSHCDISDDKSTLKITAVFAKTKNIEKTSNTNTQSQSSASKSVNSLAGNVTKTSGGGQTTVASTTTTSTAQTQTTVKIYYGTIMDIQIQDKATVTVNIDELDILNVKKDQEAEVTLDAIENETFTGDIKSVSGSANNTSGSSKYPVEVEIKMDKKMKSGMSASVSITTASENNTLLIPVEALQEQDGKKFVYTVNSDGTLSGETTVETGISDSTNVQITKGLKEGDTVYYTRGGSSGNSTDRGGNLFNQKGGFGGGNQMPEGGNMPSGGKGNMGGENR